MYDVRNVYKILVGKTEKEEATPKTCYTYEDNIRIDLKEIGLKGLDWIPLAQDMEQ
jgi:hypothetical protein